MAVKTFTTGEVLTAADTNTYLANGGLVYITQANVGTAVSSVTVSNCFSSTYDNYRILVSGISLSVGGSLGIQLNNATGSTYYMGGIYLNFTSTTVNGYGPPAATKWTDLIAGETLQSTGAVDIFAPNKAQLTTASCMSIKAGTTAPTLAHYTMNALEYSTAQHTGFTITPVSGTITGGNIRVYGYRQA